MIIDSVITRRPVRATDEETAINPRSAKLRTVRKT